jgi:hypothetical protein
MPLFFAVAQELLQTCGRSHSLEDVYAAIGAVKAVGFPSWSLDLISGLPKLTLSVWQHSLNEAVAAGPNHISTYDLQVGHPMRALAACAASAQGSCGSMMQAQRRPCCSTCTRSMSSSKVLCSLQGVCSCNSSNHEHHIMLTCVVLCSLRAWCLCLLVCCADRAGYPLCSLVLGPGLTPAAGA